MGFASAELGAGIRDVLGVIKTHTLRDPQLSITIDRASFEALAGAISSEPGSFTIGPKADKAEWIEVHGVRISPDRRSKEIDR